MPSSALDKISQQIETHGSDHFSKLYLYAAVLDLIAVRDGKQLSNILPVVSSRFSPSLSLDYGSFPAEFDTQLDFYQTTFYKPEASVFNSIQKMVYAYFRKGQLADLVFIMDKMLYHAGATALKPINSANQSIFEAVNFENKRNPVIHFLNSVSNLNRSLLKNFDKYVNCALSLSLALAGIIIMLSFISCLPALIIGAIFTVSGLYAAHNYNKAIKNFTTHLQDNYQNILQCKEELNKSVPTWERFNHYFFINKAIARPSLFATITCAEQVNLNESTHKLSADWRKEMMEKNESPRPSPA